MNTGDSIGPYVIHSALGSGGMGKVYRARDSRLGREVALKQLSDPSLTTDAARRRILQEARAAAGLSHPNIAAIFDVLDTADGPTIVMEYVPGENLARHMARGPLSPARALEIAIQISEGLIEAHARGIIHRDLKPANVQITLDGQVKILDFGIARSTAHDAERAEAQTVTATTETGRLAGTPGYMAPEQLAGGRADARTDIYALGVLLYEMLTGRRAFPAVDLLGSAMAVMRGDVPTVADVVPGTLPLVSAIVARAMAKDSTERFQTARELARELQRARLLLDTGTGAVAPRTAPGRAAAGFALAAVTAIILMGIGWNWMRRGGEPVVSASGAVFAVLPFRNSSGDAADDTIAVGLTEAVASRLSSLQSIRVLSLDESRDAAKGRDAAGAARALGARFVVDGAVRRSGEALQVDVSLVDADGGHRPAGQYTGEIAQGFDLHQRIAQGVIATLAEANAVPAPAAPSAGPTSNQQAFAEYAQARLFLERPDVPQNLDHAIRLFQSAIEKDDRFVLAYAGLGQAYWAKYPQTKDPVWTTLATAAILDALRIDPNQPEVRLSLSIMYQGLGRLGEAEEEAHRVLAMQPWNDDAHRRMAGVHIERSEWDAAVTALLRAIDLRPNYWRNHSELGFAHYSAGRTDDAVKAYTRVVELQPDSALGFHMLGTVHQSAGRLPEALENYEKANAIRPSFATHSNIGTIHFWNGSYEEAADAYERAIELAPNMPDLHANLGDVLQKLGQRGAARDSYRRAVEEVRKQLAVNDRDAVSLALLALYLTKLEDRAAADATLRQALAINAQHGDVLYAAAMVDALAGRLTEACRKVGDALRGGASPEFMRRADELRALRGCAAYDKLMTRQ